MAVILTGMGSDGTLGLRLLKRHGCFVIAQDEASCVVYGMPKAAVDAGVADAVLPLDAIAGRIAAVVKGGRG
jgi:two-component system chemotaxis response regulator CheB